MSKSSKTRKSLRNCKSQEKPQEIQQLHILCYPGWVPEEQDIRKNNRGNMNKLQYGF